MMWRLITGVAVAAPPFAGINGTLACENQHTLGDVLKNDLNFQGWVVSDYSGEWKKLRQNM